MSNIKNSVLFTFQVIGGLITLLTVAIAGFWWFAGFYYRSNFNDQLMKEIADKHELQLTSMVIENKEEHAKIFKELAEIRRQLTGIRTRLRAYKKAESNELTEYTGGSNGKFSN
jgi:uncharacterized lipoprotein YehR (DUF1307 family)